MGGRNIKLVNTSLRPAHLIIMQSEVIAAAKIENLAAAGSFCREDDKCQVPLLRADDTNLTNRLANKPAYGILRVGDPILERSALPATPVDEPV